MVFQGFGDLHPGREARIERRHRLLEDHGDVGAAHLLQRLIVGVGQIEDRTIASAQPHLPVGDRPAAELEQSHQTPAT